VNITETDQDRFWSKVTKGPGCWEWQACRNKLGYGMFLLNRRSQLAHRVSAVIAGMKLDRGLEVMHTCDNPCCVNPAHLRVGTHRDNMRDAIEKGRMKPLTCDRPTVFMGCDPNARRSCRQKVTDDEVRAIRILAFAEGWSYKRLSRHFGISDTAIGFIVRGKKRRGAGPLYREPQA
jgi:hypothetical protein